MSGHCEGFEVKVGLHQGSVLSPLLFAAVMDVVSREARSGLPSELLYTDDDFRCRQCDGTIQEVDLAEDLVRLGPC